MLMSPTCCHIGLQGEKGDTHIGLAGKPGIPGRPGPPGVPGIIINGSGAEILLVKGDTVSFI